MLVRVGDQQEDAKIERDAAGGLVLSLRPGLVSSRAFCALVLVLAPLAEQGHEYLKSAI